MRKRIGLWGLAIALSSVACAAEEAPPDEPAAPGEAAGENVGEVESALASCNAPINAHADWLAATRTGDTWCPSCSYVNIEVKNAATGARVLYYWAGIDQVEQYFQPGFCVGTFCFPSRWVRLGIRGEFYDYVFVGVGGDVSFDLGDTRINVTPDSCSADSGGQTTISGMGSNGVRYTIHLSNTWFS